MTEPDACELLCLDLPKAEALRASRLDAEATERLAELGKALADLTRVTVALALRDGVELCVCDLAWVCERSDKLVSHHLRMLKTAGLVTSRREGKMVMYALTDGGRSLLERVAGMEALA